MKFPSPLRALRHPNYRLFCLGQAISLTGNWMQTIAQSWLVYRLTGSASLLGAIAFTSQIPIFLLSPFGGAIADRYERKKVLFICESAAMILAFILSALTLNGWVSLPVIFFISGLLGVINAFDIPARQAMMPEIIEREDLMNVVALNSSMFNAARVLGPALGSLVLGTIGEGWCFFINGLSFLAVLVTLLRIRILKKSHKPKTADSLSILSSTLEGLEFVKRNPPFLALLAIVALLSLVGLPYLVLMPIVADIIFHSGSSGLGILMSASGLGAFLGALMLTFRSKIEGLGKMIYFSGLLFSALLSLFALSSSFWLSAAILIPCGLTTIIQLASINTLLQSMAPNRFRGRIMALYSMMFMGTTPIGALIAGLFAEKMGVSTTIILGASIFMCGIIFFRLFLPRIRERARELIAASVTEL